MTQFLIRHFIRDADNTADRQVRCAYGKLAGAAGIAANLLLFAAKLLAGLLVQSLSITADAFNNLSDAGSSIVTLFGFKLSAAPPDKEHPFGHGRMEYLSALAVAVLIILAGVELAKSAVDKILRPTPPQFQWISIAILVLAIAAKLWMALFYRKIGTIIHSETLRAATADSRNDVLCTAVVLITTLVAGLTNWSIDGYVGIAVSLFVIWSGFSIVKDTVSPLLGQAPDPELVAAIKQTVMSHEGIVGIHDLIVHNYGPGRLVISLHAEVSCHDDLLVSHDRIDCIERELMEKYQAVTCIHMDPVDTTDERVCALRAMVATIIGELDQGLSIHDFRVVFGETHTNLIFDLVVPFDCPNASTYPAEIERRVRAQDDRLYTVITMEHSYT